MMAKRKIIGPATAIVTQPIVINAGRPYDERNPHSWLRLTGDPVGTHGLRIMHGTLRLFLGENPQRNSAEAFFRAKCRPAESPDPLAVTAHRHEVLVPPSVDDSYADPWMLARHIDHGLARETDRTAPICCYWTVGDPDVRHLHEQWRTGRRVVEALVERYRVPMLLVQHFPEQASSANPPHLHCMAAVRTLGSRGFGTLVPALIGDKARQLFVDAWTDHAG